MYTALKNYRCFLNILSSVCGEIDIVTGNRSLLEFEKDASYFRLDIIGATDCTSKSSKKYTTQFLQNRKYFSFIIRISQSYIPLYATHIKWTRAKIAVCCGTSNKSVPILIMTHDTNARVGVIRLNQFPSVVLTTCTPWSPIHAMCLSYLIHIPSMFLSTNVLFEKCIGLVTMDPLYIIKS